MPTLDETVAETGSSGMYVTFARAQERDKQATTHGMGSSLRSTHFDQWSTKDFSILEDTAYDWLAMMFNNIEQ